MGSIDFNLPIREQLYLLLDTELITIDEKDLILEFVWTQYAVFFRKESINRTLVGSKYNNAIASKKDVENIIKGGKQRGVTFEIALNNLKREVNGLQSKQLIKRIDNLIEKFNGQEILSKIIMTSTQYKALSEKEKEIATLMAYVESNLMLDLMPVSEAAKILNINDTTVRQACQDGRVIARKFNNGWSVCLSECREYWANKD